MQNTKTIDYKFSELCEEIDRWKNEAQYWKEKYEEEISESIERTNESIEMSKKGIANALMFALSVTDDENGNMVINKQDRKTLAENWK